MNVFQKRSNGKPKRSNEFIHTNFLTLRTPHILHTTKKTRQNTLYIHRLPHTTYHRHHNTHYTHHTITQSHIIRDTNYVHQISHHTLHITHHTTHIKYITYIYSTHYTHTSYILNISHTHLNKCRELHPNPYTGNGAVCVNTPSFSISIIAAARIPYIVFKGSYKFSIFKFAQRHTFDFDKFFFFC